MIIPKQEKLFATQARNKKIMLENGIFSLFVFFFFFILLLTRVTKCIVVVMVTFSSEMVFQMSAFVHHRPWRGISCFVLTQHTRVNPPKQNKTFRDYSRTETQILVDFFIIIYLDVY